MATETILTSGLISKIEEDVIYSDVNINPGNSELVYGFVIGHESNPVTRLK